MSPYARTRRQPTVGDLVDLAQQLARDADASLASLRHRDRRLGRSLAVPGDRPVAQVLAWLAAVRQERGDLSGERLDALHRAGQLVLAIAGLLGGWGAATAVFWYDGTHPVNVIGVLAVFVLLQLLLVLLFLLSSLPRTTARAVPGFAAFQDALQLLSPGRLQRLLRRRLPAGARQTLDALAGRGQVHRQLFGSVDRWTVSHSSQIFALFFNAGAVLCAVYLVVFSDLAFSWSTTLQLGDADLARITDALSAPWAWAFADARPSRALIAATRYFRLGEGTFPGVVAPAGLGGWWPFLVMAMVVYGLLPRVLTLLLARARLRTALRRALLRLPGLAELRERLNNELVESRAEQPENGLRGEGDLAAGGAGSRSGAADADAGAHDLASRLAGQPAVVIAWAGAAGDHARGRAWLAAVTGAEPAAWLEAGGARPVADDRASIATAAATDAPLVILVKAWEPPMAEVLDFLRDLRAAAGEARPVSVVPLALAADGTPTGAEARHQDVWRRALATLGDPWLRTLAAGGDAP